MVQVEATQITWKQLLRLAAIAGIVEYVFAMATAKGIDPPSLLVVLVLLAGVFLLRRRTRSGVIVSLVGLVLLLLSDLTIGGSNFSAPRSFPSWTIAMAALITALVGITSAIKVMRGRSGGRSLVGVAPVAGALILVALVGNFAGSVTLKNASRQAGDVTVTANNTKFGPTTLTVAAGQVTFFLNNKDLQLHNFHIKGVGSAVLLEASHSTRHTFDLRPGTYSFVCDFHPSTMKGTITVR